MPTSLARGDPAGFHQYGQKLYQHGDHVKAIEVFSQALRMKLPDAVGILDNRAATYCKLGNFDLALRDAKQMIKTDRSDERGYLRAAKILILNQKPDRALEMYAYGLRTLVSDHPRRHLLQQLHDKLGGKMASQFRDPFDHLPLELAVMVLKQFDFRQIVAILRVSKKWERFLSSLQELWMCIDLSRARKKVTSNAVRSYMRRSRGMLTHVVLDNISLPSVEKTLEFVSRCPRLQYLEARVAYRGDKFYALFKECKNLKTLIMSDEINIDHKRVGMFLSSLPLLERIECHANNASPFSEVSWPEKLPNLRAIALGANSVKRVFEYLQALHLPGIEDGTIADSIPNLEELRVRWNPRIVRSPYLFDFNHQGFPRLRKLDLSGVDLPPFSDLPSSLEDLRLHACRPIGHLPFAEVTQEQVPNLKTLILTDNNWVTPATIGILAKPTLRILHVDRCQRLTGNTDELIAACCQSLELEELNVSHLCNMDDKAVAKLVDNLKELKSLYLSYTPISGLTLKVLSDARVEQAKAEAEGAVITSENKLVKIQHLYIRGCDGVASDAIAYARARGIEIFT
ncbi:hypothetical protein DTO021C3_3176 [Paecilomyces variotii]|nr:hypothetical protein DTO021C3_3176 [Paecilomyces variotii]